MWQSFRKAETCDCLGLLPAQTGNDALVRPRPAACSGLSRQSQVAVKINTFVRGHVAWIKGSFHQALQKGFPVQVGRLGCIHVPGFEQTLTSILRIDDPDVLVSAVKYDAHKALRDRQPASFQKLQEIIVAVNKRTCDAITLIVFATFGENLVNSLVGDTPMKRRVDESKKFQFLSLQNN